MPIPYTPIPHASEAIVRFSSLGRKPEKWRASISDAGDINSLLDNRGNRYYTPTQLRLAGVKEFNLTNHYHIDVDDLLRESE